MSSILGISAFYHDCAAAIFIDGKIIAAAQEERFTRKKHDPSYPFHNFDFSFKKQNKQLPIYPLAPVISILEFLFTKNVFKI